MLGANPTVPGAYDDIERHPEAEAVPGVLIVRPDAPLFYANVQSVRDAITAAVDTPIDAQPIRAVVLDLDANDELDITSAEQLAKLAHHLNDRDVSLCFAHVHAPVLDVAERAGVFAEIGPDCVFPTVEAAVAAAKHRAPGSSPGG